MQKKTFKKGEDKSGLGRNNISFPHKVKKKGKDRQITKDIGGDREMGTRHLITSEYFTKFSSLAILRGCCECVRVVKNRFS